MPLKEAPGEGLRGVAPLVRGLDVGLVASALGGGGHPFMAGFTSQGTIQETLRQVRAAIAAAASGAGGRTAAGDRGAGGSDLVLSLDPRFTSGNEPIAAAAA